MMTALFLAAAANLALAQNDLSGTWEGTLVVGPGTEIDVQFILARGADGNYRAQLNAPDQPSLRNIPADSVSLDQGAITIAISAVSGNYSGALGDGSIEGTWSQQGTDFELNLRPYQEPVLSSEAMQRLAGSWIGKLKPVPGAEMEFTIIVRLEPNAEGVFAGTLSVPEQGGNNIPINSIALEGDEVTLEVSQARLELVGTLSGDSIDARWQQAGQTLALVLERGEYEAEGLDISPLNYARLQGPWHGRVANLTIVLRVEQEGSNYMAYLDSPDQGASGIPIQELSVTGDELTFAIGAIAASFTGEIGSDALTGQWTQGPQSTALTLERGPYVPDIGLSAEQLQQLAGTWRGTVNSTELVFRFVASDNSGVFVDIAAANARNVPVNGFSLEGTDLGFAVPAIGASFAGTLAGNSMTGQWTRAGANNPLTLTKD